jgi:RND family efflux transporter MFP subunit
VRFEVPSLQVELIAREAEVAQTAARVRAAQSNATRLAGLFERGIASQRQSDEARRELQEAEAGANQALGGKQAADILAARMVIKARFAGVIARRWHNPGDQVDASAGDPVLRVIDPERLEIVAAVPVAQLPLVGPGRVARIFNPADASIIQGAVITGPPMVDAAAATGDVRVSMAKTAALTAGTPVQLEIMSDERANVLVVPTAAVLHDGMDAYVMVAGADGRAHRKSVMVGLVALERAQIVSGLTAGEQVILPGPEPITDGASITIQR